MSEFISQEILDFQVQIRKLFEKYHSRSYIRKLVDAEYTKKGDLHSDIVSIKSNKFIEQYNSLDLSNIFEKNSDEYFALLTILSEECGRNLDSENLNEKLFLNHYLPQRFSFSEKSKVSFQNDLGLCIYVTKDKNLSDKIEFCPVRGANQVNGLIIVQIGQKSKKKKNRKEPLIQDPVKDDLTFYYSENTSVTEIKLIETLDLLHLYYSFKANNKLTKLSMPADFFYKYLILKSAEIMGICGKVIEITNQYVKTRSQFGVPIGAFQGVSHQLAESYLKYEALKSIVYFASWAVTTSPEQIILASLSSFSNAIEYGSKIVETAIQLHGGIGFTWEHDLHLYLRRVKTIELTLKIDELFVDKVIGLGLKDI